jgi:hypothetical protein
MRMITRHRCPGQAIALVIAVLGCDAPVRNLPSASTDDAKRSVPAPSAPAPSPPPSLAPPALDTASQNQTAAQTEEDSPAAPQPCAGAPFHYPAVEEACARDGRRATKDVMRAAVAKAKRAGIELKCAQCHVDQTSFKLRPNAIDDLKDWL